MKEILLIGCARENSSRVPKKMIRPIGDTCLFEIYVKKLEEISRIKDSPFSDVILAVNRNDKTLWEIANKSSLKIIERNNESVATNTRSLTKVYNFLENFHHEYFMLLNGCMPFVKIDTILDAVTLFKSNMDIKSLTCGKFTYNFIWDETAYKPINNPDSNNFSTASVNPFLQGVHAFHISDRRFLLNTGRHWNYGKFDPYIYTVEDSIEFMDVDTELDFVIMECLYNRMRDNGQNILYK
jgi:CMP-N-acetylneuraminic acid synthetase